MHNLLLVQNRVFCILYSFCAISCRRAPSPMHIEEHFAVQGDMTNLRKQLRARGAEIFDEFAKYSRRFCALMGLRSEKALDLFNQIVSIKDIGGLNTFVREHMLE